MSNKNKKGMSNNVMIGASIILALTLVILIGINLSGQVTFNVDKATFTAEESLTGNLNIEFDKEFYPEDSIVVVNLDGKSSGLYLRDIVDNENFITDVYDGEEVQGYLLDENFNVELSLFNLNAPDEEGIYDLSVNLYYESSLIEEYGNEIEVIGSDLDTGNNEIPLSTQEQPSPQQQSQPSFSVQSSEGSLLYHTFGDGTGGVLNETECDGTSEGSVTWLGTHVNDDPFHGYLLVTNAPQAKIDNMEISLGAINNNPETENIIVDLKICPTDITTFLHPMGPIDSNCTSAYTVVKNDWNASQIFGTNSGFVNLTFDNNYTMLSSNNYIIKAEVVSYSASDGAYDLWGINFDSNPTNRYAGFGYNFGAANSSNQYILDFKLWGYDLTGLPTPISDCQTISSPGSYEIGQDIDGSGTCLTIASDNVIIDCNGYTINYSQSSIGYGINITGYNNITVQNCNIVQDNSSVSITKGIYMGNANDNTVSETNITISGKNAQGIQIKSSSDQNTISDVVINMLYLNTGGGSAAQGILIDDSDNNDITNSDITTVGEDGYGIYLYQAVATDISGVIINTTNSDTGNRAYGVYLNNADNNDLSDVTINTVAGYGVYLSASDYNNVTDSDISTTGSSTYAIYPVGDSDGNIVSNCNLITIGFNAMVYRNAAAGCDDNVIQNSFLDFSSSYGIQTVNRMNITNNTIRAHGANTDCLYFGASTSGSIVSDNIFNNCTYGIELTNSQGNNIYNNYFNITPSGNYTQFAGTIYSNTWNTTNTSATNIAGGSNIGGNYLGKTDSSGYSDTCSADVNGFCQEFDLIASAACTAGVNCGNNTDYLPLSSNFSNQANTISSCQTISSPGLYTLTQSIDVSYIGTGGSCINFTSDDVILDCDSYSITVTSDNTQLGHGIYINNQDNITIQNCKINISDVSSSSYCIEANGNCSDLTIINNDLYADRTSAPAASGGINIDVSAFTDDVLIENINITLFNQMVTGIVLEKLQDVTVKDVFIDNAKYGIILQSSNSGQKLIIDNELNMTRFNPEGIRIYNSVFENISNNIIYGLDDTSTGINIINSNGNNILGNNINFNATTATGSKGIKIDSGNNINVERNVIVMGSSGSNAIELENSSHGDYLNNNITQYYNNVTGGGNCIYMFSGSNDNEITSNRFIDKCGQYSLKIENSNDSLIYNNLVDVVSDVYDNSYNSWNTTNQSGPNIYGGPYIGGNYWQIYGGSDIDNDGFGSINLPFTGLSSISNGGDYLPLTIQSVNQAPTHSQPLLNSSTGQNLTSDNLTVYAQDLTDPNSDPIFEIINWNLDGTTITSLHLPFEGGSNNTYTKDYSTIGNDGTVNDSIWTNNIGHNNKGAYTFDGIHDYIDLGDPGDGSLDMGSNNFAVSLWIKTNYSGGNQPIISKKGGGADPGYQIFVVSNSLQPYMGDGTNACGYTASTIVNDNQWHHIVFGRDGQSVRLFIDGQEDASSPFTGLQCSSLGNMDSTKDLQIGKQPTTSPSRFNGTIDDVIIFDDIISLEQVQALHNDRTDLMVSQETFTGSEWQACITPNDGAIDGTTLCSNTLSIPDQYANSFDGETTDFDNAPDIQNVVNVTLENSSTGKIVWNSTTNCSGVTFDNNVHILHNYVYVNITALGDQFNKTAYIYLYYLSLFPNPLVFVDQGPGWQECDFCSIIDVSGNNYTIEVDHFTAFKMGNLANLSIWDQNDTEGGGLITITNNQINFYANYTTSGLPINSSYGDCNISFTDSVNIAMTYNDTSDYYEYQRLFTSSGLKSYNVTCDGIELLTATDSINLASTQASLNSINLNPNRGKSGITVNVTSVGASENSGKDVMLMCGNLSGSYNLCNSTSGQPERSCTFTSPYTDDSQHQVYCIIMNTDNVSSSERNTIFTADNSPPQNVAIINVEGDTSVKYWDTDNDANTVVQLNLNETGLRCRYDEVDLSYSSISFDQNCSVSGGLANCNVWGMSNTNAQINDTSVYISCIDQYDNEQSNSQNTDVTLGIDWTIPSINTDNDGDIYIPGYNVTFDISDIPPGTILNPLYCNDTTNVCDPIASVTNGTIITFNNRGTAYLRYNATDEAGNLNTTSSTAVMINQLSYISNDLIQNYSSDDHKFNFTFDLLDNDSSQTISCTIYHKLTAAPTYNTKAMSLNGPSYNGTFSVNITPLDGAYQNDSEIQFYGNCSDGLETVLTSINANTFPNALPYLSTVIPNITWDEDAANNNVYNLYDHFTDPNDDILLFYPNTTAPITVNIAANGDVSYTPQAQWFGIEYINFLAEDPIIKTNVSSNFALLTVYSVPDIYMNDFTGTDINLTSTLIFNGTQWIKQTNVGDSLINSSAGNVTFQELINVTKDINLTDILTLKHNLVEIDSTTWPNFNVNAKINLTGLTEIWTSYIFIMKDGIRCDNTSDCTVTSWDNTNKIAIFDITGFSNYTVENAQSAPNVTTPIIYPSIAYTNDSLICTTNATDLEQTTLNISFTWYENGVLNTTWDNNVTCAIDTQCNASILVPPSASFKHDNFTCLVTAYDGITFGHSKNSTIEIDNLIPLFDHTLDNFSLLHTQDLYYDINCSDTDTNDVITYYDDTSLFDINSASGIINFNPNLFDTGNYTITITCSDAEDNSSQIFNYEIKNTIPTLSWIYLNSTGQNQTLDNLTLYYTYYDINSDAYNTTRIRWFNNSVEEPLFENLTVIPYQNTKKGETWNARVYVYDGVYWSIYNTSNDIVIEDTLPFFDPSLTNQSILHTEILYYNVNCSDVDDDTLSYYEITAPNMIDSTNVNTGELIDNPSLLETGNYTIGLQCGYTTTWVNTTFNYEVRNTAPTVSSVYLNSTNILNRTNGTLNVYYTYNDVDFDPLNDITINWYLNDTIQPAFQNLSSVPDTSTTKHDDWIASISVFDGIYWSSYVNSSTLTINNQMSYVTNVKLNTTFNDNLTDEDLFGYYMHNDIDNDPESAAFIKWYLNDTEQTALQNTTTVLSGNTTKHETWIFSVSTYDGEVWANFVNSSPVLLLNDPPEMIIPNQVMQEDTLLYINLTNFTLDIDNDPLTYYVQSDNPSEVNCSINSNNLTLDPADNWFGITTCTINVTDTESWDDYTFNINVTNVNDPPYQFSLVYPGDEHNFSSNYLQFNWSDSVDIDITDQFTYYLQIDNDEDFVVLDLNITVLDNNHYADLSGIADDWYNWQVIVCDDATPSLCNSSLTNTSFIIDRTGPNIILDSPNPEEVVGWTVSLLTTINDTMNTVDNAWYEIRDLNNILYNSSILSGPNFDSSWITTLNNPIDRNYTLIVYANDSLGNQNSNSVTFQLDNNMPGIQIIYPVDDNISNNFNLDIRVNNMHLDTSYYQIINSTGAVITSNYASSINQLTYNWTDLININGWNDDLYNITVFVNDTASNNNSKTEQFNVDQTSSYYSGITKTSDPIYNGMNITLNVTWNDLFLGVKTVLIESNHSGTWRNYSTTIATNEYYIMIDNIYLDNQEVVGWRSYAYDYANNLNVTPIQEFIVQNRIPVFDQNLANQTRNHGANLVYDINCSDADNDVITYYDDTALFDINPTSGLIFDDPIVSEAGDYVINITCSDSYSIVWQTFNYTITNGVPYLTNIKINSTDMLNRTNETLYSYYVYNDADADPETLTFIKWYKNNVEQTGFENSTSIPPASTTKHDMWNMSIKVFDGNDWSIWYNTTILINNAQPDQIAPLITPSPASHIDNITCFNQSTNDIDTDNPQNIYSWLIDGQPYYILHMPFEINSTEIFDYSGYDNDGDNFGAALTSGYLGSSYYFNSTTYIRVNYSSNIDIQDNLTVAAWVKSTANNKYIISKEGNQTTGLCYQEQADSASACGLSSGAYLCTGDWNASYPCTNIYDSSFSTYGIGGAGTGSLYINYTKPTRAISTSQWRVKDLAFDQNHNIPAPCWAQDPLQFRLDSNPTNTLGYCFNGATWTNIITKTSEIYEEAMWWESQSENFTYALTTNNGGEFIISKDGIVYNASASGNINDNAWHFIAGVYDGTEMRLYVDGSLAATNTYISDTLPLYAKDLMIGTYDNTGLLDNFQGNIDQVKIVDDALSEEQILELFNEDLDSSTIYFPETEAYEFWTCIITAVDGEDDLILSETNSTILIENIPPTLSSVLFSPGIDNFGSPIVSTTIVASDYENDDLRLMCGNISGSYNFCNSTYGQPERSCTFYVPWTDDTAHLVYCAVDDSINVSNQVAITFTTDNTPPFNHIDNITSIGGDTTPYNWDSVDDNTTEISMNGELLMSCRWDRVDTNYSNISSTQECLMLGITTVCDLGSLTQNITNEGYYITCMDAYGNEQNITTNVDVPTFGTDWTPPSTYSNVNDSVIYAPTFNATLYETDIPIGTNVTTYCCNDTSGVCVPTLGCDPTNISWNNITLSFDDQYRGKNYLNYQSIDDAGNMQTLVTRIVNINQLLTFDTNQSYNDTINHLFNVEINVSDKDTSQSIECWLHHKLSTDSTYQNKSMYLSSGLIYNGTFKTNISMSEGYVPYDYVNTYVECFDGLEYQNSTNDTNQIPNYIPTIPLLITPENNSITNNSLILFGYNSTDNDTIDTLTYYIFADTNVNPTTLINVTTALLYQWTTVENLYYWMVNVTDNYSNVSSDIFIFTLDTSPPVTTSNVTFDYWYNDTVGVYLNATDNLVGVNYTKYCIYDSDSTCDPITSGTFGNWVNITCIPNSACQQYINYYSVDHVYNQENITTSNKVKINTAGGLVNNSEAENCELQNVVHMTNSGCFDTYMSNSTIINSTTYNDDIYNSYLNLCNVNDTFFNQSQCYNSTVDPSTVIDTILYDSTVTDGYLYKLTLYSATIDTWDIVSGIVEYNGTNYTSLSTLQQVYCGDGITSYPIEGQIGDCNSCPADFGPCPSKRGGSGGGFVTCQPTWECEDWGDCSAVGEQIRTCIDANGCSRTNYQVTYTGEGDVFFTEKEILTMIETRECTPYISESCHDQKKNQDETDIDCGGMCGKCDLDKICSIDQDCTSGNCLDNICKPLIAETCNDEILNQDETTIDCGGSCSTCTVLITGLETKIIENEIYDITVKNEKGFAIENAQITILLPDGSIITSTTDENGLFTFQQEQIGSVSLTVQVQDHVVKTESFMVEKKIISIPGPIPLELNIQNLIFLVAATLIIILMLIFSISKMIVHSRIFNYIAREDFGGMDIIEIRHKLLDKGYTAKHVDREIYIYDKLKSRKERRIDSRIEQVDKYKIRKKLHEIKKEKHQKIVTPAKKVDKIQEYKEVKHKDIDKEIDKLNVQESEINKKLEELKAKISNSKIRR
ncbi:LamG-like jellyroll fold domain-containing protein [Nanoarchaeota archaeon]